MATHAAHTDPSARQHPWEGFWQITSTIKAEETFSFRGTTTTERAGIGFLLYTEKYFMEMRITGMRQPPSGQPPTDAETEAMFDSFECSVGQCSWRQAEDGWQVAHEPIVASHPTRLSSGPRRLVSEGSEFLLVSSGGSEPERWRRLTGAGNSPLSGVWESGEPSGRWLYLTTAGHYGVLYADQTTDPTPHTFSANMGARLETDHSFDHWPMLSQTFGYDTQKHMSFKLETVEPNAFVSSIPTTSYPPDHWRRLE
jgi:hypothetical protein